MNNSLFKLDLIRPLIYILVVLCAIIAVMPGTEAGESDWLLKFDYFLSFLISPVIAVLALFIFILKYPKLVRQDVITNKAYISASILVCLVILLSYVVNGVHSKETFTSAINFAGMSLFLLLVVRRFATEKVIWWSTRILAVWSILPLFALLTPDFQEYVLQIPCDFQGLADGRLLYGFWCGVGLILLINSASNTPWGKRAIFIAISLAWVGLVFSRSRASMAAIALSLVVLCFYENWQSIRRIIVLSLWLISIYLIAFTAWQTACANGLERPYEMDYSTSIPRWKFSTKDNVERTSILTILWKSFGIEDNELKNIKIEFNHKVDYEDPTRSRIYSLFWQDVQENWLIGHGKMNLIHVPGAGADGKGAEAEAHNLFLQFLSNYGVVALAAFLFWLMAFYLTLQNHLARMLFVYLIVYSQFQPVFGGTTNMFAVIPMLVFLLIMAADGKCSKHNTGPFQMPRFT